MSAKITPFPYYYTVVDISEDDEVGYTAIIPKFPKIYVCADTVEELHSEVQAAIFDEIEYLKKEGGQIPKPDIVRTTYSGRLNFRMPPEKHERLAELAAAQGCSLNSYILRALEEKIG